MSDKSKICAISSIGLGFVDRPMASYVPNPDKQKLLFPNRPAPLIATESELPGFFDVLENLS